MASNSLLEGIVFGDRVVRYLVAPEVANGVITFDDEVHTVAPSDGPTVTVTRADVQALMWDKASLSREAGELEVAIKQLNGWTGDSPETANLITVARLVVTAALAREESRGAHYRTDFSAADAAWQKHLAFTC